MRFVDFFPSFVLILGFRWGVVCVEHGPTNAAGMLESQNWFPVYWLTRWTMSIMVLPKKTKDVLLENEGWYFRKGGWNIWHPNMIPSSSWAHVLCRFVFKWNRKGDWQGCAFPLQKICLPLRFHCTVLGTAYVHKESLQQKEGLYTTCQRYKRLPTDMLYAKINTYTEPLLLQLPLMSDCQLFIPHL